MKTGWYSNDEYFVVKPLHNGKRQSLVMGAQQYGGGKWNIVMGVFSCNATYRSISHSPVWINPTSTNKNPSPDILFVALEALNEIEQEIHKHINGKKHYIYVDGLDERRIRVYTRVLTKKCGYKKSTVKSDYIYGMSKLYKRV